MKTVFGSVLYEQALKWQKDFIGSINAQTSKNFDVLLMNDGVSSSEVQNVCCQINRKTITINVVGPKTISEIRIELIKKAKLYGYDLLILGDFDDAFSLKRVEKIQESYCDDISFFYNDIYCNGQSVFVDMPKTVTSISQIEEENFLGLSNTAINLSSLEMDILNNLSDVKTNVFDWYFYSILLIKAKATGMYISDAYTYYRQHANNIAGAQQMSFAKEIEVKTAQYSLLAKYYEPANRLLNKYRELALSEAMIQQYIRKETKGYWWSLLKIDNI